MLQSGNLEVYNSNLRAGNLSAQSVTLSSGGRGLTGPATYISVESDPIFSSSPAGSITQEDIDRWNQSSYDLVSYYVTKDEITQMSYVTNNDLRQALSPYVAYTYLSQNYVSYGYASENYVNYSYANENYVSYQYLDSCSYATEEYVTNEINEALEDLDIEVDLSNYVTKTELSAQSYLTSIPDEYVTDSELGTILSTYATKNYVDNAILNAEIGGGDVTVDLDDYLRKDELPSYLLGYVTKQELSAQSYITQAQLSANSYLTQAQLSENSYATKAYVVEYVANHGGGGVTPDLSDYVTKTELSAQSYLTSVPSGYATEQYVDNAIDSIEPVSYVTTYETIAYNSYDTSIWQGTLAQYSQLSDYTTYQLYLIAQE